MSLAAAIDAYRRALPEGELELFREDGVDRLGVPVVAAALRPVDGPQQGTHGYGATEAEAEVGALGELAEFSHTDRALRVLPRVQGSYRELVRARGRRAVADPLTLCLPAGSPYTEDMPLTWLEVRRLSTGERVLVPEEWVATTPSQLRGGRPPLITPITNGQGAGLTFAQALSHGLLELLQRDGNGLQFRALDQGVVLDLEGAPLTEETRALLERFRAAGIEVLVKLATTELGVVNLYVVGRDPLAGEQPLVVTACGEAADPDRDRALRKALLEYAASRARKAFTHGPLEVVERVAPPGYLQRFLPHVRLEQEEQRALEGMAQWASLSAPALSALLADTVYAERRRVSFTTLPRAPAAGDAQARLAQVTEALASAGLDVLVADLSPAGRPISVVKALVPGLEVETMSYHRIGERGIARLLARGDALAGLGPPPPGARPVRLTREAEARLGGPAWFDVRAADRLLGRLYPLYREPERHAAQLALRTRRFGGEG